MYFNLLIINEMPVNPDKVNPDKVNPDKVNPDKVNPDKVNPDTLDENKENATLPLIIALNPTAGAVINKGLCSVEVASIIVKEYCNPTEFGKIFDEIDKNNLQINENSWKLFSLLYKNVKKTASIPNIYIKCLLDWAIENENNEIDNMFCESLSSFVGLIEESVEEEFEGLRAMIISKFLKGFFTINDYLEFKKNGIDMDVFHALYEPLDEIGLNFLKNIANLGFVGHSQYLCFRAYSQKGVTVERCKEIKNKYKYFGDKEFKKEFGES